MPPAIILASGSQVRLSLLQAAGLILTARPARMDEDTIRQSLVAEGVSPRDQSDILAEMKGQKLAASHPDALVIGCDQILDFKGQVFGKPASVAQAREQLCTLRGQTHMLHSAAVAFEQGRPVWRHISTVRLQMRDFSDAYLDAYLHRNADHVLQSCGAYQLESEGVRLFDKIDGDYFAVLGLPMIPLLTWMGQKGLIPA